MPLTELTHAAAKAAQEPNKPKQLKVDWKDSFIITNGTNHSLPTTKEYLLKEYVDIFQGIGTLPGRPYHIRIKQYNQPIQHPPCSVPMGMQKAYRAELDRMLMEGTIAELHDQSG